MNLTFLNKVTLPEITESALMWIPLPLSDSFQTIEVISIKTPGEREVLNEHKYGNKVLLVKLGPDDSKKKVELLFNVQRIEKALIPKSHKV